MKKSVFIAVLGVAASVATSYGQGYIVFDTYATSPATYVNSFGTTTAVQDGIYNAELLYAFGTVLDPVTESSLASVTSDPTGLQVEAGSLASLNNGNGSIQGPTLTIPGYTGGAITFEMIAFNGSSYDTSTLRGRSGTFTMTGIQTSSGAPASYFSDNGPGQPNFVVGLATPEPTTLALAGLGGLASLVALRRKQA
jgi:hypothetical protein